MYKEPIMKNAVTVYFNGESAALSRQSSSTPYHDPRDERSL